MKIILPFRFLFLLLLLSGAAFSQQAIDTLIKTTDTIKTITDTPTVSVADTAKKSIDTIAVIQPKLKSYHSVVDSMLFVNEFINIKTPAIFFLFQKKQKTGREFVFYALCVVVFILGLFKTFYNAYFNNLFRVFFNTSIRQNQLTDQLLQAKLPSFILNIFFTISAGFYIWLLFRHYHPPQLVSTQLLLPFCILGIGALYFAKYCILKFIGWMSEMQSAADNYIFVIFLINKITGIILVPFIVLMAFAMPHWINYLTTFSLLLLGLFFLSRYVKTYGVLEYRFPLQPLHFVIYITAVEIVPLLVIYKMVVDYVI